MDNLIHSPGKSFVEKHTGPLLLAILVLAAGLRLIALGSNPPGLFSDEASTGYDAFCLLQTGRDQYGEFLPLFARSFGDFNEALYRYLTVPWVWAFGLTEQAVRTPAALIGTLTTGMVFLLCRPLFGPVCALACTLSVALSPWHILFSRVGFRAILLPFFICLGLVFFLRSLHNPRFLYGSSLAFGVSLYTYSAARIFIPLFVLGLLLLHGRQVWQHRDQLFRSAILGFVIALPAVLFWFSPEGMARADFTVKLDLPFYLLSYYSYFSPEFLFFHGDPNLRHSLPYMGQMYFFGLLTVPAGLWYCWRQRNNSRSLLLWLLLYPVAAALTGPWHALRSIPGAVVLPIISGCGIYQLFLMGYRKSRLRRINYALVSCGAANVVFFLVLFFAYYPKISSAPWLQGYRQAIQTAAAGPYDRIFVSDRFHVPHIFVLFYTSYSPRAYQANPLLSIKQGDWTYSGQKIGRFQIVDMAKDPLEGERALLMVRPDELESILIRFSGSRSFSRRGVVKDPWGRQRFLLLEETRQP